MDRRRRWIAGAALATALVGGTAGIAGAAAGGDDGEDAGKDVPITGAALDRAGAAALAHTGGGRVTGTEVGDEEGYYEVEVTMPDGSQVDVHLDQGFKVLGTLGDSDTAGER
jgi:uncharacterized membrane protein YkoI